MLQQGLYLMAPEVPSHPDQSGVVYTFPDIRLFFISCNVVGKMEATRVSSDGGCGVCQGVAWQQLQLQNQCSKKGQNWEHSFVRAAELSSPTNLPRTLAIN